MLNHSDQNGFRETDKKELASLELSKDTCKRSIRHQFMIPYTEGENDPW